VKQCHTEDNDLPFMMNHRVTVILCSSTYQISSKQRMTEQLKEKPIARPTANDTVNLELCTSLAISVFLLC